VTILLIDESQQLFKSNDDFWERMKLGTQLCQKSRSLIVVMAAAYGLAASPYGQHSWQNPNVETDPTSSAQQCASIASEKLDQLSISGHTGTSAQLISNAEAAIFGANAAFSSSQRSSSSPVSTPFKLHTNQIITITPIDRLEQCHPIRDDGPMTLTLHREEFEDLCSAWGKAYDIKLGTHVVQYIYFFSGGQASSTLLRTVTKESGCLLPV
jgi:hypothetical protein